MSAYAYNQYKNTAVETASPGKLLLMLYDAAIRNLDKAQQAILEKDIPTSHKNLVKTQDIIKEFMCTLNMDYEISKNLFSLYEYMLQQLVQANVKKDPELVAEVRGYLTDLRETWQTALRGSTATMPAAMSEGISRTVNV